MSSVSQLLWESYSTALLTAYGKKRERKRNVKGKEKKSLKNSSSSTRSYMSWQNRVVPKAKRIVTVPPSSTKPLTGLPCCGGVEGSGKVAKGMGRVAVMLAAHDCDHERWRRSIDDISVWCESECDIPFLKKQHPSPESDDMGCISSCSIEDSFNICSSCVGYQNE